VKAICKCSADCIQGLLGNIGSNAFWQPIADQLAKWGTASAATGAGAAALAGAPVTIPLMIGAGCVIGNLLISHRAAKKSQQDEQELEAALNILRRRSQASLDFLHELDVNLQLNFKNFHLRFTQLEQLLNAAQKRDGALVALLQENEGLFIALDHIIFENHTELKDVIAGLEANVIELGTDLIERLSEISQTSHDTNHRVQALQTNVADLKTLIIALQQLLNARKSASDNLIPALPGLQNQFVGREQEQKDFLKAFDQTSAGLHITGINGQGGIGKTALALVLGHQLAPRYPNGQLLIDLRGTTTPTPVRNAMEQILLRFRPTAVFKALSDDQLAHAYADFLAPRKILIILDNAAGAQQVTPLIPAGHSATIITSRKRFPVKGIAPLPLDLLSEPDAAALARTIAPRLTKAEAQGLAEACGRLALAIRVAATQIATYSDIKPAQHIANLRSDRLNYLDAVEPDDPEGLPFARRVFTLSLEKLDPRLRQFWTNLSVFPRDFDASTAGLVACGDEPIDATKRLSELNRHALVEFDESTERYSMHDIAKEFGWKRSLDERARDILAKRHAQAFAVVLDRAAKFYLHGKPLDGLALLDREMPNVLAGQSWAAARANDNADAARLAAWYPLWGAYVLNLRLHARLQIDWLETSLAVSRQNGDRDAEGNALGNLGTAHANLGDARRAVEYYERALAVSREIGDRPGEGKILGNLGTAHFDLGDIRRAIEYYEQHVAITREIGDRRGEGSALGNLGIAHTALRDLPRAIEYLEQQLAIAREIADRRGEGNALGGLGNAHADVGDARRAIECYEQALSISREIGDRRGEGATLGNLGNVHADLADARSAIAYWERWLVISRETDDLRSEGKALVNIAVQLAKLEQWSAAAKQMTRAAEIFATVQSPDAHHAAALAQAFQQRAGTT
jgi:tetratricopeptide (TPR) repeat protein